MDKFKNLYRSHKAFVFALNGQVLKIQRKKPSTELAKI